MTTQEQTDSNVIEFPSSIGNLQNMTTDQAALAAIMLGSLGTLVALRRGLKGIGPLDLTGSTLATVEFAAMLMLVGSTIRLIQIYNPDRPIGRALAFIY